MSPQAIEQYRAAFESHTLTRSQIAALLHTVSELSRQVEWFKRQLFGAKSERRLVEPDPSQGTLGGSFDEIPAPLPAAPKIRIEAHERERKLKQPAPDGEQAAPFFDEAKVPVTDRHIRATDDRHIGASRKGL